MSANPDPVSGSPSFWRIVDVPFETYVAALDSWLGARRGVELRLGGSQLLGPLHPPLRMRLDVDRWSSSSTALELIPGRLVRPTPDYFRAGRLLLDSLTRSLPQHPEPLLTPSIAA